MVKEGEFPSIVKSSPLSLGFYLTRNLVSVSRSLRNATSQQDCNAH